MKKEEFVKLGIDEETANSLKDSLEELYSDCDIELHYGGQPIYYYVVSVE